MNFNPKPINMSTEKAIEEEVYNENTEEVLEDEEQMASATLASGQVIESDGEIAVGSKVFVTTEEGEKVPVPAGTYDLQGGGTLVVDESGTITEVGAGAPAEETQATEEEEKEKMGRMTGAERYRRARARRALAREARKNQDPQVDALKAQIAELKDMLTKMQSQTALNSVLKSKKKSVAPALPTRQEMAKMETKDLVKIIANQYK